jgi:hypothetical protein
MSEYGPEYGGPDAWSPMYTPPMRGMDPGTVRADLLTQQLSSQSLRRWDLSGQMGMTQFNMGGPLGPAMALGFNAIQGSILGQGYIPGNVFGAMPSGYSMSTYNRARQLDMQRLMASTTPQNQQYREQILYGFNQMQDPTGSPEALRAKAKEQSATFAKVADNPYLKPLFMATFGKHAEWLYPGDMAAMNVAQMSGGFYQGGGRFGLGSGEMSAIQTQLMNHFMPDGKLNFERSKGFMPGQISALGLELQSRGLLGDWRAEDPGTVESASSAQRGRRVVKRMDDYLDSMSLAGELTGQGKNIDARDAMAVMQSMTGGVGQMSAGQITNQMEKIREVMKASGIAFQTMVEIVKQGGDMAQRVGLSSMTGRALAVDSIMTAAVASSTSSGGEYYGRASFEELTDANLRNGLGAALSPAARRAAGMVSALKARAGVMGTSADALAGGNLMLRAALKMANGEQLSSAEQQALVQDASGEGAVAALRGIGILDPTSALYNQSGIEQEIATGKYAQVGAGQLQGRERRNIMRGILQGGASTELQRLVRGGLSQDRILDIVTNLKHQSGNRDEYINTVTDALAAAGADKTIANQFAAKAYDADRSALGTGATIKDLDQAIRLENAALESPAIEKQIRANAKISRIMREANIPANKNLVWRLIERVQKQGELSQQDIKEFAAENVAGATSVQQIYDILKPEYDELKKLKDQSEDQSLPAEKRAAARTAYQMRKHALAQNSGLSDEQLSALESGDKAAISEQEKKVKEQADAAAKEAEKGLVSLTDASTKLRVSEDGVLNVRVVGEQANAEVKGTLALQDSPDGTFKALIEWRNARNATEASSKPGNA